MDLSQRGLKTLKSAKGVPFMGLTEVWHPLRVKGPEPPKWTEMGFPCKIDKNLNDNNSETTKRKRQILTSSLGHGRIVITCHALLNFDDIWLWMHYVIPGPAL